MSFLLPQLFVTSLTLLITLELWLSYRNRRSRYLFLACFIGAVEFVRHILDSLQTLLPEFFWVPGLAALGYALVFTSSYIFVHVMLLRVRHRSTLGKWMLPLIPAMIAGAVYSLFNEYDLSVLERIATFMPLIVLRVIMVWIAFSMGKEWRHSWGLLLIACSGLLVVRSIMPWVMGEGFLYYIVYQIETLIFFFALAAISITSMEQGRRKLETLLEDRVQAERELQFILDNSADVILTIGPKGTLLSWSKKAEQVFGYTAAQAIGNKSIAELLVSAEVSERFQRAGEFEIEMQDSKGLRFPVLARVQTAQRDNKTYQICMLQDISMQKKLRRQEAALNQQIIKSQRLESLGVLAGGIAHDFNNILMGLFGNLSMAREKIDNPEEARKFLQGAEGAMTRATKLSGQLLTFAKGGEPTKEAVDLVALIEEVVNFDLAGSTVQVSIDKDENLLHAHADKGQMQQIFSNLTINAKHAMSDGGQLHIRISSIEVEEGNLEGLEAGDYLLVRFKDEGEGIDPENLEHIFDPYFSTKKTGSGLGLATSYSIVNRHGGHISVSSTTLTSDAETSGTEFTLYLPATHEASEKTASTEPQEQRLGELSARVLLMDDEEMIRDVATQMLQSLGLTVDAVSDGEAAVASYLRSIEEGDKYSLVILDLTIPGGMGGKETIQKLLEIDKDVVAIVSSGYAEDAVIASHIEHGFCSVIAKPYTLGSLEQTLSEVLGRSTQ